MKRLILLKLALLLLFPISATPQDAMPTKEETVNYLNKRLQEVEGRTEKVPLESGGQLVRNLAHLSFTMKGDVAVYTYSRIGGIDNLRTLTLNPAHIDDSSVIKPHKGETIGWIHVNFKGRLVKQTCKGKCDETQDYFTFPYLAATPEAGERIKKAFLHLRDLAKAEDDLFSN